MDLLDTGTTASSTCASPQTNMSQVGNFFKLKYQWNAQPVMVIKMIARGARNKLMMEMKGKMEVSVIQRSRLNGRYHISKKKKQKKKQLPPGPVFCLLLGVSSDYAQPITGQVTEVTCPVIGRAQPELTPSKRQKMGPVKSGKANQGGEDDIQGGKGQMCFTNQREDASKEFHHRWWTYRNP